jgi:monomeric isocitrate dehydrogenase
MAGVSRLFGALQKNDVQTHGAVEVERETKLPAAGRLVSSTSCQHVTVTAMPSDVLVDAARR